MKKLPVCLIDEEHLPGGGGVPAREPLPTKTDFAQSVPKIPLTCGQQQLECNGFRISEGVAVHQIRASLAAEHLHGALHEVDVHEFLPMDLVVFPKIPEN